MSAGIETALAESQLHDRRHAKRLAQLGAFLARTGEGAPGVPTIWQGYQRLHDFLYALETPRAANAFEKCIMLSARRQARLEAGAQRTLEAVA